MSVAWTRREWAALAGWALAWMVFNITALAAVPTPDLTVGAALRTLTLRAGTVITGRIVNITHDGDVVTITLSVEETLKGTASATYMFHEWAGLWPLGQSRYEVGQRATFFLQAPSKSGLATPVDGSDGVVPIAQESADQPAMLDVRRLAARVQRSVGTPMLSDDESAISLTDAKQLIRNTNAPVLREPIRRPLPIGIVNRVPARVIFERPLDVLEPAR
jgi:hypothetical protein